jgi:hypothetical protein
LQVELGAESIDRGGHVGRGHKSAQVIQMTLAIDQMRKHFHWIP